MDAPLVILPGLICGPDMFDSQLAAFPGARAIGGFYGGARTIEAMADHVIAQLPGQVSLLGHSMGARIALEIVRKAPERVARLALVDTGVHPVAAGEREKRLALRDVGRREGFAALVDRWLPPMIGASHRGNDVLVARLRAMCLTAGQDIFEAQIDALLARPALDNLLPVIACPTAVIVGAEDEWSPVAQHEDIARTIPGATLCVIEGAGHMLPAEEPALLNRAIGEWLAQSAG
ncbi:alpha/beta fold hydrolase [Croceicoccus bisphenolivorans]|uniref:alpha/beta fold hydrolase n=1 Tax=Croceicoccus bisphenolivorans TaxID=1783232 RepID=UPI0008331AC1|nr:alpha/beta hydrolase [Croceicoccus bisphenolivorans]